MNSTFHKTVLLEETIEGLQIQPNKVYVDVTFGGGGHTKAILESDPSCKVIALDWDEDTIEEKAPALQEKYGDRFTAIWGNYSLLQKIFKKEKITAVDGILADFGTSQHQIYNKPGLSFKDNSPLDMRISPAFYKQTAADILNKASEKELVFIFSTFGEEHRSRTIAKAIVEFRKNKWLKTTAQLRELIESVTPLYLKKKRIHPATKVFQALRIAVNKELDNIKGFLFAAIKLLNPGGRIACISFHSLEDRIVKTIFNESVIPLKILTTKPITPSENEVAQNPSSRSAKLRIAEKL